MYTIYVYVVLIYNVHYIDNLATAAGVMFQLALEADRYFR